MNYRVKDENPKLQYYILRLIYIIIIILGIVFFYVYKLEVAYKGLRLSSIVLLGTALFIGESTRIGNKKSLVSYVNAGIFWFIAIEIIFLLVKLDRVKTDNIIFYQSVGMIMQYLLLFQIIIGKKKKISFKSMNIRLFTIFSVGNLIYFFIIKNTSLTRILLKILHVHNIIFLITIILFILVFMNIVINNESSEENFFCYSIGYLLLYSISNLIVLDSIGNGININIVGIYIGSIIRFTSYYILAEGLIRLSLNKNFNDINKIMTLKRKEYRKNRKYLKKKIRELNELENLLTREEVFFNKIVSAIGDYLFLFNEDKLFYINNNALKLLSLNNREDILFKSMDEVKEMIGKRKIYDKESICLENYSEIIFKDQDGEFQDGEIYTINFGDDYSILIIKDVTKRNNAFRLNKYLMKQLEEENIKGEFFTNICHELRTPINVINSALQLNDLNIKNENIKSIERNNLVIRQNCLRLIRTINNFIDTNKISEGHMDTLIMAYNIVEVVENVLDASSRYIKKKNISFIFDPDFEEIFIAFDKDLLERVILNILSNSVKYGKVNGKVYIRIYFEEENLVIMIENDGDIIGFDEQKYIFDKFTKNNKALNRTQEGSGLGLYISKSLMKIMGGDLKVEINESKGNQFKLYFYDVELFKENERIELELNNEYYNLLEKVEIEFSDIYI